ncbi:MAG: hypothetical protein Q7R54_00995 [bacterium]|nr:hypothetical protein [bacterium]
MDPELKSLLTETLSLAKDNHRMLRAMRRAQVWGFIGKLAFWAVIILVPLYFLQPYLDLIPSTSQIQEVLKAYQGQY